ncbi:serine aminopeptidase domain-containing protein [Tardiphaga sp.]|jgi:alpha-beta hydrolase superfamily lysophospholipase|uniref:serine aminopeptidase domain-containing protein n=1 Tax=Tardiphaga sp. TaxID=1926292 RepID=UPI0037DA2136
MNSRYGIPVTFETFGGLYHAGSVDRIGRKAILLLSPISYEELLSRATWRTLADMIAASGHACLRFDYPGTSDAIDIAGEPDGIADWLDAARRSIAFLREHNPGLELVLVGQGFGATLAAQLGAELQGVAAAVLMAPVVKGRSYLRELQAWSNMLTERIGIGPDPVHDNGYCVAGLPLANGRVAGIKAIDLTRTTQSPAPRVLLVDRTQTSRENSVGNHLATLGADVSYLDYAGYENILQNPSVAEPQLGTLRSIVSWIDDLPPGPMAEGVAPAKVVAPPRAIAGPHYEELPVRFGPDGRLFGVLCKPLGRKSSAIAVLANSGRDYHIGWGRAGVEQARALAERGIASFRFDAGGIGDSIAAAGAPDEVLYSDEQLDDLRCAIDYAATCDAGPIAVAGRCSGAYGAFQIAVQDPRVRYAIPINIQRFVWDPRESVAEALQSAHRSIYASATMLLSKRNLKRLLSGNLRIGTAAGALLKRLASKLSPKPAETAGGAPVPNLHDEGHRRFKLLEDRGVRVALLFSEGDHGLNEFRSYMGRKGAKLRRYSMASITIIPGADHDFTHAAKRAQMVKALGDVIAAN